MMNPPSSSASCFCTGACRTTGKCPNLHGYTAREGWACPRCASVYSPETTECQRCNARIGLQKLMHHRSPWDEPVGMESIFKAQTTGDGQTPPDIPAKPLNTDEDQD